MSHGPFADRAREMIKQTCSWTRYGPNRVAADVQGNGEFDFWVIYWNFWKMYEDFCRKILEEFWKNWIFVRKRRSECGTHKENEVLTPLWPPNSLGGHRFKMHESNYICYNVLFFLWAFMKKERKILFLTEFSASPQLKRSPFQFSVQFCHGGTAWNVHSVKCVGEGEGPPPKFTHQEIGSNIHVHRKQQHLRHQRLGWLKETTSWDLGKSEKTGQYYIFETTLPYNFWLTIQPFSKCWKNTWSP